MKANFLFKIKERGYLFQSTDEDTLVLGKGEKLTFYLGFDCTAQSLHLGHLLPIMVMRYIAGFGHKVIILLGGGTTKIGDPSGKDKTRQILEIDQIEKNVQSIKQIILKFIDNAIFVNNAEWLDKINYLEFLRDIGRHFSINRMLEFESVKSRLERESHLSFLEFNYMILQAYDFVELNKRYGCRVQVGGSDQWGNIINGIELARKLNLDQLFGITTPLITTASGQKMGKTASGAIWLDETLCTPYEYWQYFRNIDDSDVIKFLKLFTELPIDEIHELEKKKDINELKKILATEATAICHGRDAAEAALDTAIKEFEFNDSSSLPTLSTEQGENIVSILVKAGFAQSNSDAKRFIKTGAVKIDDKKIDDINFIPEDNSKISLGKKRVVIKSA